MIRAATALYGIVYHWVGANCQDDRQHARGRKKGVAAPSAVAVVRGVGTDFHVLHLLLGPVFVVVVVGWIGRFDSVSQSVILKYPEDRRQPIPTHTHTQPASPKRTHSQEGERLEIEAGGGAAPVLAGVRAERQPCGHFEAPPVLHLGGGDG